MQIFKYGPIEPYKPSPKPEQGLAEILEKKFTKMNLQRILDDYIAFLSEVEKDSSLINNKEFIDYLKVTLKLLKVSRLSLKRGNHWTGKKEPEIIALYAAIAPRENKNK